MTDESVGIPGVASVSKPRREDVLRRNNLPCCYGPDIPAPFPFFRSVAGGRLVGKGQGRPIPSSAAEIKVTKEAGE